MSVAIAAPMQNLNSAPQNAPASVTPVLTPILGALRRVRAPLVAGAALATFACAPKAPLSPKPSENLESMIQARVESAAPNAKRTGGLHRGSGYKADFEEFQVDVRAGHCYTVVGAADATVESLHILVWNVGARKPIIERPKSSEALVKYCADKTGVSRVRGKVGQGSGHFALAVFEEAQEAAPKNLDEEIVATDAGVPQGAERVSAFTTQVCKKEDGAKCQTSEFHVQLNKFNCYWFVGAAQSGDEYAITVKNASGAVLGEASAVGNVSQVGYCSLVDGMVTVQVKVKDPVRAMKLAVFKKYDGVYEGGPTAGTAPKEDGKKPRDLAFVIKDEAQHAAPDANPVGAIREGNSSRSEFFVQLEYGQCYWIVGATTFATETFDMSLWDAAGNRVGEARNAIGNGTIGHCPADGGMFKVKIKPPSADSAVKFGVFANKR